MILGLFESTAQRQKDERDLTNMFRRYGDDIVKVLQSRVDDAKLTERDRKHWARLLRKAKSRYR